MIPASELVNQYLTVERARTIIRGLEATVARQQGELMTTRQLEDRIRRLEQTVAKLAVLLSSYLGTAVVSDILRDMNQGDGSR